MSATTCRSRPPNSATVKNSEAALMLKKDGSVNLHGRDVVIDASGRLTAKSSRDLVLKGTKISQN